MEDVKKDPRFAHIVKDARFRRLPKKHVKIKVDKRFESMFTDENFQIKCKVDKRGRPIGARGSEDLKRYYDLSGSEKSEPESEAESSEEEEEEEEKEEKKDNVEESDEEEAEVGDEEEEEEEEEKEDEDAEVTKKVAPVSKSVQKTSDKKANKAKAVDVKPKTKKLITKEIKKKLRDSKIDYARGEAKLFSESSSEEESSDAEDSDAEEHDWGEFDNDAETTEEASNRLAICNMDWDRIKAADLMVLFHSFLPSGGLIQSITIYPSEFGMQRMKEEEEKGPNELTEIVAENEDENMDRKHMEKLRKYQLNRLKYYYAIMVCDTKETANALYKECDGLEYESSSVKLDLRFVPDDTTFDQEPKDTCTALPDLSTYRPRLFQTTALTRSKVELTWDENDPDREDIVRSVHRGKIDEEQLKQYLAYSSSDDDDEDAAVLIGDGGDDQSEKPETEQSSIDKYKSLLADIESNEKKKKDKGNEIDLEVTWNLELENKANEMVKEKMKNKDDLTPFEQYVEKRKEKKKKKKAQAEEERKKGSEEDSAFSDDDLPSDVDLNDPYFKEELDEMKATTKKKKKKGKKLVDEEVPETEEDKVKKAELELLMLDDDNVEAERRGKHFSLKKIEESEKVLSKRQAKKRQKKLEADEGTEPADDFKIDVNDERFSALYTSHHFNIDPTDPQYKATKGTRELIEEKLRRRAQEEPAAKSPKLSEEGKRKNAELSMLVKNIKKYAADIKKH